MNLISEFETPCRFYDSSGYCDHGVLYDARTQEMCRLEGTPIYCHACDGTGYILTKVGEQLMDMIWRRLERKVYDAVREVTGKD